MRAKKIPSYFASPLVLVLVVALVLFTIGLSRGPLGSALIGVIRPSAENQITPTITPHNTTIEPDRTKPALPKLALSFDDGPNPLTTPLILKTLEKYHVKASFFVVGNRVTGNEHLLRRMYRDGFDIGNHSWSHPDFNDLSKKQIARQIIKTEKVVAAAGVPAPYMFRPPYGVLGKNFPKDVPLAIILWNIDPEDWAHHDPKYLTTQIIEHAKPGGIIDLHGIYLSTAQSLGPAIKQLKKHYRLVTVSELLDIKPGDTGKYYGDKY